ncbi:MAG: carboxypeptidase regulatory-like domain-containing protein [Acidobacteria bacterium]|nr:carboxypeptidase regulatory-like domain-containing protein [Acidobacteriota bacterium]
MRKLHAWVGCLLLGVAAARSQTSIQCSLSGIVRDASSSLVQDAKVTATNGETGVEFTARTGDDGVFLMPRIVPGSYTVAVEKPGFRRLVRQGITISINQAVAVNLDLEVGDVADRITVVADAGAVQSQTSEISLLVNRRDIRDLPLNGKDFQKLMFLAPGVGGQRATNTNTNNSISGAREGSNNYVIDGVSANDERQVAGLPLGASSRQLPNVIATEALEQFRVVTSNADATFGRGAGGQINAITRSGTNDLHGSAYEFFRNDALDARDFFNAGPFFDAQGRAITPPFRQNLFGAAIGGPIKRNKHFFFGNYEGFRQRLELTSNVALPNADLIRLFPGTLGTLARAYYFDTGLVPASGNLSGELRPFGAADRQAAVAAGFAPALFDANVANGEAGNTLISRSSTQDFTQDAFLVRTDHLLSERLHLSGRVAFARNRSVANTANLPGTGTSTPATFASPMAQLVYSARSNHVFEARLGVMRVASSVEFLGGFPEPLARAGVSPEFGIAMSAAGTSFQLPQLAPFLVRDNQTTPQLAAQHTWTRGRLTMRGGFDSRLINVNFRNNTFPRPTWQFAGLVGRNGLLGESASARDAVAASVSQTFFGTNNGLTTPQRGWRSAQQEYYTQADWRATRNLTLNLGVRYSYFGVYREVNNALSNLYAEQNGRPVLDVNPFTAGRLANLVAPLSPDVRLYKPDRNNWQPRIGFAWSPSGRTVIRGAYGLYFDRVYQLPLSNLANNIPYATARSASNVTFRTGDLPLNPAQRPVLFGVDPALRNPYLHRLSAAIERELAAGTTITAAYVGSIGRDLIRTDEPNMAGAFPQALRPDQRFTDQRIIANLSSSDYDSLQLTARRRFTSGLSATMTYTWSSFRDDSSTDFFPARPTLINLDASPAAGFQGGTRLAPRPVTADYGRSENDAPHVLVASWVYDLPFGNGRRWGAGWSRFAEGLLGGWALSGLFQVRSGPPFEVTLGADVNDDGYFDDRPTLTSGLVSDLYQSSGSRTQFLLPQTQARTRLVTPSDVTNPFATIRRNSLRGDRVETLDLSLLKRFALTERVGFGIECNLFNALNHANLAVPNGNLSSQFFGQVTGTLRTTTPRQIQLGARLSF